MSSIRGNFSEYLNYLNKDGLSDCFISCVYLHLVNFLMHEKKNVVETRECRDLKQHIRTGTVDSAVYMNSLL